MLNEVLENERVKKIIKIIKNVSYQEKNAESFNYKLFSNQSKVLFIFYSALFKYKIIIDEEQYFPDFLEQIDKLLKKLNNIDDLTLGINKLICRFTCLKLGIKEYKAEENRIDILKYFYDKYVINGYFFHGFSSCYKESIERYGLRCEEYVNFYEDFSRVNEIFHKYNISNILEKDFTKKEIYFTDDFVKSCSYSANSPGYFYNLLYNRDYNYLKLKKDILSNGNYDSAFKNLKKILNFLEVTENDKNFIIEVFNKEWNLLFSEDRKITLLAVKRNLFSDKNSVNIDNLINDESIDIYEAVDKILCERNSKIVFNDTLSTDELEIISLEGLWQEEKEEDKNLKKLDIANDFRNVYGNVSSLILLGSILISLGVIISLILLIGG